MPELFSSTTANEKYSLFFGPREMDLFNNYNTELLEIVSKQSIVYWPIEVDLSDVNILYGESEKKIPRNPIKFYAWIMHDEPEIVTGSFGSDRKRRIEVYAHKDRLTEVGIYPKIGDYLEYDNEYFEIIYSDVPNFVHGHYQTKIGVTIKAVSTREDIFSPKIENSHDDSVESNSSIY